MIDEQIKLEIQRQVNKELFDLKKSFELFNLPLISQYTVLSFSGLADGTDLVIGAGINIAELQGKYIVIKSFKCTPYYSADGNDFSFSDGTTEQTWNNTRIERLFDFFTVGANFRLIINGVNVKMFPVTGNPGYPLDFFVDNVFYKYPEKLQALNCQCTANVVQDMVTGAADIPNVKITIEAYLI